VVAKHVRCERSDRGQAGTRRSGRARVSGPRGAAAAAERRQTVTFPALGVCLGGTSRWAARQGDRSHLFGQVHRRATRSCTADEILRP